MAVPLFCPQVALVDETVTLGALDEVTVALEIAVQEALSVTVTE